MIGMICDIGGEWGYLLLDLTYVTLVSEETDETDEDDESYPVIKVIWW